MRNISRVGLLFVAGYVASIILANFLIANFKPIQVWPFPALYAPAGVLAAGFAFSFRNATQQTMGRAWGFGAIVLGAVLSYFISSGQTVPGGMLPLAWASGLAFLFSESADALVWTKLRQRHWWTRAMFLGDLAGQVADSAIFLLLALGSLEFLAGQIVGKLWTTWLTLAVMIILREVWNVRPLDTVRASFRMVRP